MSTTAIPNPDERQTSQERGLKNERLRKVQAFVQDVLRPADTTLGEQKAQADEVRKFESRQYQLEAWDALWQAREQGADRGLIHLATGLGKTSVAVFDYAKFRQEQESKGESARALFVVHQNAILDQADERFNEVLPHILPGVGMSRFSNRASSLPTSEVVFSTFQALDRGATKFPKDYFDYIVYDEAHHTEAKTYKDNVVQYFIPKFQLALTATPERGDGKDITDHFGEALYTKTLPEGIAEGYLAEVHYRLMLDEEIKTSIQNGARPKNITELNRVFEFEARPEVVAEKIKAAQQEIRDRTGLDKVKTIIFDPNIQSANEMARLMGGESYHSASSRAKKKSVLSAFRSGELETIVTRDMFNEGVDIPDAMLIVFRRSTQSKTIFEQQLGRGLRKADGKDEVTVLDFVANAERIRLVRELASDVNTSRRRRPGGAEGNGTGGNVGGLSISRYKSDFVFDQEIIDILALYDHFNEKSDIRADWSTWSNEEIIELADSISEDKYLTQDEINELSKRAEFISATSIISRFGSTIDFNKARGISLEFISEDYVVVSAVASGLRMGVETLNSHLEALGIEVKDMINAQGKQTLYICKDEIDAIKERHHKAELPDEGMIPILSAAELLGRKPATLEQVSEELQMTAVYRRTNMNRLVRFFTESEIQQIKTNLEESVATDDMLTLTQSLAAARASAKAFDSKAGEFGISPVSKRSLRGKMAKYYFAYDVERIKEAIGTLEFAPTDYMSVNTFKQTHGIKPVKFDAICKELSIELATMLSSRGQKAKYLSPTQQEAIIKQLSEL